MEWVELDAWGRECGRYVGDASDLRMALARRVREPISITEEVTTVLLSRVDAYINEKVRTTLVVMRTHWGTYRWIPRPMPYKGR